jgi:hypothetical protein
MSENRTGAHGTCDLYGKAVFASPEAAERRRKRLKHMRGDPLEVFRCTHCHKWHLGHGREERRSQRRHEKRRKARNAWRREIEL